MAVALASYKRSGQRVKLYFDDLTCDQRIDRDTTIPHLGFYQQVGTVPLPPVHVLMLYMCYESTIEGSVRLEEGVYSLLMLPWTWNPMR